MSAPMCRPAPITVGEINASEGQAYVVNDLLTSLAGIWAARSTVDLIAKVSGFLDAHSGGRTQMEA